MTTMLITMRQDCHFVSKLYLYPEIPSRGLCPWTMPVGCARYLYVAGLCQIYTAHVPLGMCHWYYFIEHISWVSHVGYVSGASIYWKYPPDKKYPGIYLGGIAVDINYVVIFPGIFKYVIFGALFSTILICICIIKW